MVYHQEAIISSIQCALSTQIHVAISIPDVEISVSASKGLWGKHMGGDALTLIIPISRQPILGIINKE